MQDVCDRTRHGSSLDCQLIFCKSQTDHLKFLSELMRHSGSRAHAGMYDKLHFQYHRITGEPLEVDIGDSAPSPQSYIISGPVSLIGSSCSTNTGKWKVCSLKNVYKHLVEALQTTKNQVCDNSVFCLVWEWGWVHALYMWDLEFNPPNHKTNKQKTPSSDSL